MPIPLDPTSIQLLLSVADLGSISKAASRHGLTQPSASRRIRDLERRLGAQLLDRSASGARLTPGAARLVEHFSALVAAGDRLAEAAAALGSDDRRSVSLAVSPPSAGADLTTIAMVAGNHLPELELDVTVVETIGAASGVRDGSFGLAVVDGPDLPIGLSGHVLVERSLAVVVGPAHRWHGRTALLEVDEIAGAAFWLPPPGTGTRDVIDSAVNQAGLANGLRTAGTATQDLRLAQAQLGRHPAIVRADAVERAFPGGATALHRVATPLRLVQPIRLVWKGRQPQSAAAFDLWHRLRTVAPHF